MNSIMMKRIRINDNFTLKDIFCISLGVFIMAFGAVTNIDDHHFWSSAVIVWLQRIVGLILVGIGITTS